MNRRSLWISGLSILALALIALNSEAQATDARAEWRGDVVVRTQEAGAAFRGAVFHSGAPVPDSGAPAPAADLAACRARIAAVVCLVDPMNPDEEGDDFDRRACQPGGEKYAAAFEGHFDRSVPVIQRMYCHLSAIWVEKSFVGTAYAGLVKDPSGRVTGGGIGIRREVLESRLGFDDWISWKEETSFGGSPDSTAPRLGLLNYVSNRPTAEFFLDYVLNHEFGHIFDFANALNRTTECRYREKAPGEWERVGTCEPLPGSWGALSWRTIREPLPGNDFAGRERICFYFCDGNFLKPAEAAGLFAGMLTTNFPSTYASRYPAEDFAEVFALKLGHEEGLRLRLEANGQDFDLSAHFLGPKLAPKRAFVEELIRQGPRYPGP